MDKIECDLINVSICLSELDKDNLRKADNGKIYLNIAVVKRKEKDKYGNDLNVCYARSKEEREAGVETKYLKSSNAKTVTFGGDGKPVQMTDEPPTPQDLDDLPF